MKDIVNTLIVIGSMVSLGVIIYVVAWFIAFAITAAVTVLPYFLILALGLVITFAAGNYMTSAWAKFKAWMASGVETGPAMTPDTDMAV